MNEVQGEGKFEVENIVGYGGALIGWIGCRE